MAVKVAVKRKESKKSVWDWFRQAAKNIYKRLQGEWRYHKETTTGPPRAGTAATYGITPCVARLMKTGLSQEVATKQCRELKRGVR